MFVSIAYSFAQTIRARFIAGAIGIPFIYRLVLNPIPIRVGDHIVATFTLAGPNSECANVDMELEQIGQYTLEQFCAEMKRLALDNPSWWKRHSDREEIEEMFDGCTSFRAAIHDIEVLDGPRQKKAKKDSSKVVDLG